MKPTRAEAYATLSATRPRPAVNGSLVEAFGNRLRKHGAVCNRIADGSLLPAYLLEHFAAPDGAPLAFQCSEDEMFDAVPWNDSPQLARQPPAAREGVALALGSSFVAVAETGSLAVYPRAGAPMALNFLPDRLVLVVREQDIVANLEDFWTRTRERFGTQLPRGLCLVSGPSSSGDIAMTFATGVHGPLELHALILG